MFFKKIKSTTLGLGTRKKNFEVLSDLVFLPLTSLTEKNQFFKANLSHENLKVKVTLLSTVM